MHRVRLHLGTWPPRNTAKADVVASACVRACVRAQRLQSKMVELQALRNELQQLTQLQTPRN
jgi:hypothetical protein